jgi:hypothetical protein
VITVSSGLCSAIAVAVVAVAAPASAQKMWIGAGVHYDMQRFAENLVPDRLDGSAVGWRIGADILVRRHVRLAAEWSDGGTIEDVQALTLDVHGRTTTITSTFRHRTRSLSALAGYGHELTPRIAVAYLIGVAVTDVRRIFSSDAAASVLLLPSAGASMPAVEDRFPALTGGVTLHMRLREALYLAAGVRTSRLRLEPDLRGWSVRPFIGAEWAF